MNDTKTHYYLDDLKTELRIDDLSYDPWGAVMGAYFDLCAELYYRHGFIDVLLKWDYRPSPCPDSREPDSHWFDIFEETHTGDLIAFGRILNRYAAKLRTANKDY